MVSTNTHHSNHHHHHCHHHHYHHHHSHHHHSHHHHHQRSPLLPSPPPPPTITTNATTTTTTTTTIDENNNNGHHHHHHHHLYLYHHKEGSAAMMAAVPGWRREAGSLCHPSSTLGQRLSPPQRRWTFRRQRTRQRRSPPTPATPRITPKPTASQREQRRLREGPLLRPQHLVLPLRPRKKRRKTTCSWRPSSAPQPCGDAAACS